MCWLAFQEVPLKSRTRDYRSSCSSRSYTNWITKRMEQNRVLEGDCANLFHKLKHHGPDLSSIGTITSDIKHCASLLEDLRLSLVRRTANKAAHALARAAMVLLRKMRVSTMALIRRGFAAKKRDDAVFLFRQMLRMRPHPSVVQFTKLLSVIVKMKHFFKRGYEPDATTFTTLIKGLFLDDKVMEAGILFKKLLTLKLCEPNEVTILTVINGLCKARHTLTAYDLLGLFEKTSFKPNVYSYSIVIDSLCKDRMIDEALQLLAK
ncbi:UNVERIFIED_CONTAM: putative pentatricopeptide repeat-containing protein, mitochondrial [Sesamum latifolium]|uniref:Pentatricopeptide repeat-containing protein, mitochondrial n=1 Tax=Sesamum latifolium TaxID=2727402 RepID=A0AAW2XBQ7_9LAMI